MLGVLGWVCVCVCVVDILAHATLRKLLKLAHFLFESVVKGDPHLRKHTHGLVHIWCDVLVKRVTLLQVIGP